MKNVCCKQHLLLLRNILTNALRIQGKLTTLKGMDPVNNPYGDGYISALEYALSEVDRALGDGKNLEKVI